MATLQQTTAQLALQTEQSNIESRKLNKENIGLRTNIAGLKGSVDKYTTQTKRVQFLESLTDSANTGLADTFQETLMGPLTNLADAIPGKAFLLPFLKLAAQKTPLKGLIEGRAAAARDKMQDAKARDTIAGSGMEFNSKEEEEAMVQKLKLAQSEAEQKQLQEDKMKSITDLLGVQQDKFESIVGKTEEAEEKISKSGKSGAAAVGGGGDDGGALAVEQQRDESRASERRHNELIQAIKGDGGGSEPTIKDSDGSLGGVGGVIKSIGKGFKYLGNNLKAIAKGALAMALMGASLIPFALAAVKFNDVEWESLAKAGVALVGLAAVGFLIGKASGSMILGALGVAILGGALYAAGKGFELFQNLDWETIGKGFVALAGLAAIGAVAGLAAPLIIAGAFAVGLMGIALIPFAYAAQLAAPALTEIVEAFKLFEDVDTTTMLALPAALAAVGAALVAMSAGNFVSGIMDGIGKLFGNESPIDKIVRLADAAPNILDLGVAMRGFGDDVDKMMSGLDRMDVDKIDTFSEGIEKFVDSMPGVIGTAKIAAFAVAFASIAASAGVAPAVAKGIEQATGEVIEVTESPKAYVAKKQKEASLSTQDQDVPMMEDSEGGETVVTTQDSKDVPEGMVKVKYKGKMHTVKREDAEKIQAQVNEIDEKRVAIRNKRNEIRQEYKDTSPMYRMKRRNLKRQDARLARQEGDLEGQREQIIGQTVEGSDYKPKKSLTQAQVDMATQMGGKVPSASSENAEMKDSSNAKNVVVAPTTVNNNQSTGGGGSSKIMPVPVGNPDTKTMAMIANSF
jgi:hypothetical protein